MAPTGLSFRPSREPNGTAGSLLYRVSEDCGSGQAVVPLLKEAASKDSVVRRAALEALANIGDPRAGSVLSRCVAEASARERDGTLLHMAPLRGGRRLEAGDTAAAAAIASELLSDTSHGAVDPVRPEALGILARASGGEAVARVKGVMTDSSMQVRRDAPGNPQPAVQEGVVDMLLHYSMRTPAVIEKERLALLPVLGHVGGSRSSCLAALESRGADPEIREAAVRALSDWPSIAAYDTLLAVPSGRRRRISASSRFAVASGWRKRHQ